jgi:hypothetical protein
MSAALSKELRKQYKVCVLFPMVLVWFAWVVVSARMSTPRIIPLVLPVLGCGKATSFIVCCRADSVLRSAQSPSARTTKSSSPAAATKAARAA